MNLIPSTNASIRVVAPLLLVLAAAGCASQHRMPHNDMQQQGPDSRMAPTQSTTGTGNSPQAQQAAPANPTMPVDNGADSSSTLPRLGPTQNTKGTGANPDALKQ